MTPDNLKYVTEFAGFPSCSLNFGSDRRRRWDNRRGCHYEVDMVEVKGLSAVGDHESVLSRRKGLGLEKWSWLWVLEICVGARLVYRGVSVEAVLRECPSSWHANDVHCDCYCCTLSNSYLSPFRERVQYSPLEKCSVACAPDVFVCAR